MRPVVPLVLRMFLILSAAIITGSQDTPPCSKHIPVHAYAALADAHNLAINLHSALYNINDPAAPRCHSTPLIANKNLRGACSAEADVSVSFFICRAIKKKVCY